MPNPKEPIVPNPLDPRQGAPGQETVLPAQSDTTVLFDPSVEADQSLFGAAYLADSPSLQAARNLSMQGLTIDPNYRLDEAERKRLRGDMNDETWNQLSAYLAENTTSAHHSDVLKGYFFEEVEREKLLADAGMKGLAVRVLANVTMPESIAMAFATGGLSHLTKIGAMRGAARLGVLGAVENAALEAALAHGSATRDMSDVAISALGGFALGAGVGKLIDPQEAARAAAAGYNRAASDTVGEAMARGGLDQKEASAAAEAVSDAYDDAGAMRARDVNEPLVEISDQFNIAEDAAEAALSGARFDVVGRLGSHRLGWVRDAARGFAEEGVGVKGYGVVRIGASERANNIHRTTMTPTKVQLNQSFGDWADEMGYGRVARTGFDKQADFYEQVGDAVRGFEPASPHVAKAANETRKFFSTYLALAKRARVQGLENVPENPNYLPRMAAHDRIRELYLKYGENNIIRLVSGAIRSNLADAADMSEEIADRIARAYVKKLRRLGVGMDSGMAHGIRTDDLDFLKSMLREDIDDEDLIETILATTQKATEKTSRVTRAKQRLDIDETFTMRIGDDTVRVVDLFERNAEKLMYAYSRSMSGWIGLAEQLNIRSPGDLEIFFRELRSRLEEAGESRADIDKTVQRFQFLANGITGVPIEADPGGLFATVSRAARDINFVRVGGAFGLAQIPEIANMIAAAGFRNVLAHVPELFGMIRRARDGTLDNTLARELEAMIAPGTDRLLNTPTSRWDEYGFGIAPTRGKKFLNRLDEGLQRLKRLTADLGGVAPITVAFQRMAACAMAQKFATMAYKGTVKEADRIRMRGLGLSDDMQDRIFDQIRQHSTRSKGTKLRALGIEKWEKTDPEAADALTMALHREARRIVQENDIGASTEWLESTTGRLLTQFRTFALTAWTKQTLRAVHHRDQQAFMQTTLGTFMGALAYIAQTHLNVKDEKDRKERLQLVEIVKAGFQKSGVSSLVPGMVDTTATTLFRQDPFFAYGRSSGLASGFVKGNPTVDSFDKIARAAGLPAVLADPNQDMTRTDWRAINGLLPVIGGMHGVRRALEALEE